ncbi:pilus assembly protein [Blastococcus sp. TML/M2B]|uniref:TadE/TadG family type IV pilus assembly protein n=1 Tax=unclassified Blastococcus TaxID=2619396 RepID=UPI00190C8E19|nr:MULTISPECIES: TadE/TadG family type IV pilus assembly protein [unclassified Blastococcus]MBN1092283.1 pilus assembly protein [Blastococcus sp. TML/M2B]MBN1097619.1 pilus assembly protein [Blastococcus sp. TML/C7B]
MRRLTLRTRLGDERGAVGVMVALLLVPLLGFAAIAVDLSAVQSERAQLRNGTDAAALAVATDCAWRPDCGDELGTATALVSGNSGQAGATVSTPTVQLGPVGSQGQSVTVTATAQQKHWFAPVLGRNASTVSAASTAAWSGTSRATAKLPLAIGRCEYDKHRSRPSVSMEASNSGCTGAGQANMRFVWLATDSGSVCQTTASVGAQVARSAGGATSMPSACANQSQYLFDLVGTTVLLPVVDDSQGSATSYRVYGFAAFKVSGYDLGTGKSWAQMSWFERLLAIIDFLIRLFTGQGGGSEKGLVVEGSLTTHVQLSDARIQTSAPDLGARSVFLTEQR